MSTSPITITYFWVFIVIYGLAMYALAPRARTAGAFFHAHNDQGRPASGFALTCSIFISWIFAKSVTNAANLGAQYGFVGGLAYACYWLSIPVCGLVLYRLRRRLRVGSLTEFLILKHGRSAAAAFGLVVVIRLYNEIWSNTAVIASYFGPKGTTPYYVGAGCFTIATLAYSLKGGLRSSLMTDTWQTYLFLILLAMALWFVLPEPASVGAMAHTGSFMLDAGGDLLLVTLLQIFSYPFQDPVLTDRGFITGERTMLTSFVLSGALGFVGILAASFIGIYAYTHQISVQGDAPLAVAQQFGQAMLLPTALIMMVSAGSTLDSAFAALAKFFSVELARLRDRPETAASVQVGALVMISFAVIGNLPLLEGADILQATTLSGTMVLGLAPVFLLERLAVYSPASFHCSFWTGIAVGVLLALGLWPSFLWIGTGAHADLLGANLYGLLLCGAGYLAPAVLSNLTVLEEPGAAYRYRVRRSETHELADGPEPAAATAPTAPG